MEGEEAPVEPRGPSVYFATMKNKWFNSVPDKLTATRALELLDEIIDFGRTLIRKVAFSFRGAVPPPPWPSPELHQALQNATNARDGIRAIWKKIGDDKWAPGVWNKGGKLHTLILKMGGDVWDKSSTLEARWQYLQERSPLEAVRDAAAFAAEQARERLFGKWAPLWWIGGTIAVGYMLYAFSDVLQSAKQLKGSVT